MIKIVRDKEKDPTTAEDDNIFIKSPNGKWFKLVVDNDGNLATEEVVE